MSNHTIIKPEEINNTFELIGNDWFLITSGTPDDFNTMTAAWGGLGVLWHKKVCYIFVRPNRYTYTFLEKNNYFSLSFFAESYRKVLNYCGTTTGKDVDKVKETGITPVATENGTVYFEEAKLIIECKKIYHLDIDPANFYDPEIEKNYPNKDYHRLYVGEIKTCLKK